MKYRVQITWPSENFAILCKTVAGVWSNNDVICVSEVLTNYGV